MAWTTPGTATAGSVLTASFWNTQVRDQFTELAPLFTSFTDYSATQAFANFTKGNGTVQARYLKIGRLVLWQGRIDFGSTTSLTGSYLNATLPFAMHSSQAYVGIANYGDSATRDYPGVVLPTNTTTVFFCHPESGNFGGVNNTNPFTWTTNDLIRWTMIYEAAS
jgi:hypothetical protein